MASEPGTIEQVATFGESVRPERPVTRSLASRVMRAGSTLLVVLGLTLLAYWGHETGWTFSRQKPGTGHVAGAEEGLARVRRSAAKAPAKDLPPALREQVTIEFPSAEVVDKAGIDIAPAWRAGMTDAVTASGEVSFDPTRVARLSPRAAGYVWRVMKRQGDHVKAGEVLALLDAAEVGKAKADFLQALVQARLRRTAAENLRTAGGVVPEPKRREAEAAVKDAEVRLLGAEQALLNLGLPVKVGDFEKATLEMVVQSLRLLGVPEGLDGLNAATATANLLPVRAPFAGVLVSVDVVGGEVVETGKVLFVVVDPSRLWLTLHVRPEEVERVKVGQPVKFRPDGWGAEAEGRVTFVGTTADETTRTVPVRAELSNANGELRASTLGRGRVVIREEPAALVVPLDSVQRVQGVPVVFVRDREYLKPDGPKAFHVRAIKTGASDQQNVEILSGLSEGDVVASKGTRLLLSEFERFASETGSGR